MPNITLSLQENILKASREYAKKNHTSLNALIRELLAKTVLKFGTTSRLNECFQAMDKAKSNSKGKTWAREDLYRA